MSLQEIRAKVCIQSVPCLRDIEHGDEGAARRQLNMKVLISSVCFAAFATSTLTLAHPLVEQPPAKSTSATHTMRANTGGWNIQKENNDDCRLAAFSCPDVRHIRRRSEMCALESIPSLFK